MAWYDGLTERQRRFCEAYAANGGNAMGAAKVAGYSKPQQQGIVVLESIRVAAALEELRKETTNAAIATREERQSFWTSILRGQTPDGNGELPKFADRLKASELLGRSQADFIERTEGTHLIQFGKVTREFIRPENKDR